VGGTRFLVTQSPIIIEPDATREWPTLRSLIGGMFDAVQTTYLYGWLKCAYVSLLAGKRTPGQALGIAGPAGCGKSLVQQLITLVLGGRVARPFQFMSGKTPFNSHLFGAEHLMVEDEIPSTTNTSRREFGAQIKAVTVNVDQSCHPKGATPVMLRPFWRLTITLNDEPENLMVLPPMDESLVDKIILLKASFKPMPMATATPDDKARFWDTLVSELPGLLAFIVDMEIPVEFRSDRFGITHYQDPELLARLNDLAPESKLLSIIENYLLVQRDPWQGRAEEIEREIVAHECPMHYEARKLLSWNNACGTYLGRLKQRMPDRITHAQVGSDRERIWTIRGVRTP
jgi:hypothetical protein